MLARLLSLLLLLSPALAETVRFKTKGGVQLVGELREVGPNAPTVICIPMFRHAKETYRPLVDPLARAGINTLLLDTRGHGQSAPELRRFAQDRDPKLFNAMHHDVAAAIEFLSERKRIDTTRIGLIGASVGCSVAVDYTVRHPGSVRAVVLLTPGSNYLEVPTLQHLRDWPGTAILVATSTEEEAKSKAVMEALKPFSGTTLKVVEGKGIHGTRMFGKVTDVEKSLAAFMRDRLVDGVDVRVPRFKEGTVLGAGFVRRTLRLDRKIEGTTYTFLLFAIGSTWTLGAMIDQPFIGKIRMTVDDATLELPFYTTRKSRDPLKAKVVGLGAGVTGTQASAGKIHWINVELPAKVMGDAPKLTLDFHPEDGKVVRLPGGSHFVARLQPMAGE
jgi:pimeloyl-ACP methyl ester carboxylesterase